MNSENTLITNIEKNKAKGKSKSKSNKNNSDFENLIDNNIVVDNKIQFLVSKSIVAGKSSIYIIKKCFRFSWIEFFWKKECAGGT